MNGIDIIREMKRDWTEEQWCQASLALDNRGMNTDFWKNPEKTCLMGRTYQTAHKYGLYTPGNVKQTPAVIEAEALLQAAVAKRTGNPQMWPSKYNDTHTWADVQALIDDVLMAEYESNTPDSHSSVLERELVTA